MGVVPGIKKLTAEGIPVRLAVSLHAPSDELRDELVPMNKRFNTAQVLDAAHDYWLASKRRVSIEYALMRGINDQAEHAQLLAKRLNHYGDNWAHVNPIPLNPIEGSKWTASKPEDEQRFLGDPAPARASPPHCVTPAVRILTAPAASLLPRSGSYFSASLIASTK